MSALGKILILLGSISIIYGIARFQIVSELTARNNRVVGEYTETLAKQYFNDHQAEMPPKDFKFPKELLRLRNQIAFAGGMYEGLDAMIGFIAAGLVLQATGYYLVKKQRKTK